MKQFKPAEIAKRKRAIESERLKLAQSAQETLKSSKRAIFAFQREDRKIGVSLLDQARVALRNGSAIVRKQTSLAGDGVWTAALEEYTEAAMFASFLDGKLMLPDETMDQTDAILGGLADTAGEIARHAVLKATQHDKTSVERAHKTVLEIVEFLAGLDLTGSLRSKFDQSKQHLRKIEDIRYDLSK